MWSAQGFCSLSLRPFNQNRPFCLAPSSQRSWRWLKLFSTIAPRWPRSSTFAKLFQNRPEPISCSNHRGASWPLSRLLSSSDPLTMNSQCPQPTDWAAPAYSPPLPAASFGPLASCRPLKKLVRTWTAWIRCAGLLAIFRRTVHRWLTTAPLAPKAPLGPS